MTTTLLSARQVRDLLDVDASTIYRMAGDGRLPAVRVGRQWRFPADAIDRLLAPGRAPDVPDDRDRPMGAAVPPGLATAVLETVAPALGVSMVVTDLAGRALTAIVNPSPFVVRRLSEPGFADTCAQDWAAFAAEPHLAPRLRPGRFGFLCAHSFVRDGARLVAMVLAGGIAGDGAPDGHTGAGPADAADPAECFRLDAAARGRLLEALPRTAALLSRIVADREIDPLDPSTGA